MCYWIFCLLFVGWSCWCSGWFGWCSVYFGGLYGYVWLDFLQFFDNDFVVGFQVVFDQLFVVDCMIDFDWLYFDFVVFVDYYCGGIVFGIVCYVLYWYQQVVFVYVVVDLCMYVYVWYQDLVGVVDFDLYCVVVGGGIDVDFGEFQCVFVGEFGVVIEQDGYWQVLVVLQVVGGQFVMYLQQFVG